MKNIFKGRIGSVGKVCIAFSLLIFTFYFLGKFFNQEQKEKTVNGEVKISRSEENALENKISPYSKPEESKNPLAGQQTKLSNSRNTAKKPVIGEKNVNPNMKKGDSWNESSIHEDKYTGRTVRKITSTGLLNYKASYHTRTTFTDDGRYLIFTTLLALLSA